MTKGLLGRLNNKTTSFNGDITCGPMKAYLRYNSKGYWARIPCPIRHEYLAGPYNTLKGAYSEYIKRMILAREYEKRYEDWKET